MLGNKVLPALLCVGLGSAGGAHATSVSYYMNQSNVLNDGVNYLQVTIDDEGIAGFVNFRVDVLPALSGLATSNFGIQEFGFNVISGGTAPADSAEQPSMWVLPLEWSGNTPPPTNQEDGFGQFDVAVKGSGTSRQTSLQFSFLSASSPTSFLDLSSNTAGQGNAYFAAHVAGFDSLGTVSSGYFGATTLISAVPLPAPLVLLASALVPLFGLRKRRV